MTKENTDTQNFSLSFSAFGDIFSNSLKALIPVTWRTLVIYLVLTLPLFLLFFLVGLFAPNGLFEEGMSNTNGFSNIFSVVITILFVIIYIIYIALIGISGMLVIKNYINKKPNNPIKVLFVDSWKHFWTYLWLMIRVLWYVLWPSLTIILIPLSIYRSVKSYFPFFIFFHFNKSVKESLQTSIKIAKGNWWSIVGFYYLLFCFMFGAYFSIIIIFYLLIALPTILLVGAFDFSSMMENEILMQILMVIGVIILLSIYFIIIFALSSLFMSFSYFFTLYMIKAKKISV